MRIMHTAHAQNAQSTNHAVEAMIMNFSNFSNFTKEDNSTFSCDLDDDILRSTVTPEAWNILLVRPGDYAELPLYVVIFITGLPLNIFIIVRLVYKKLYKQSTFLLLLNLAICDFLVCIIPIFNNIIRSIVGQRSFGETDFTRCHVCKIAVFFIILNFLSTFNLALISIDRFIYFKFSISYNKICSSKRMLIAVIIMWTVSILLGIPPLAGIGDVVFAASCGLVFITPSHLLRGIPFIGIAILLHSIVFGILVVTNVWVVIIGCKQLHKTKIKPMGSTTTGSLGGKTPRRIKSPSSRELHRAGSRASQQLKSLESPGSSQDGGFSFERRKASKERAIFRKQLKLLQVFGGILAVHFVTLIPALILISVLTYAGSIPPELYTFVLFSISSQATLHPLVESFITPELRNIFTDCCKRCKQKRKMKKRTTSSKYNWKEQLQNL